MVRKKLGWKHKPFEVPEKIMNSWREIGGKGEKLEKKWNDSLSKKNTNPSTHPKFGTYFLGKFKKAKYTNHISGKHSIWWKGKYKIL